MFNMGSYIGYTLLFCVPPLILLWMRKEFFAILKKNIETILLSTAVFTLYGSLIWPIALHYGAWAYANEKITSVKLLNYVYIDDILWWAFVSFLITSFITVSAHFEEQGTDIVLTEVRALLKSFMNAFHGLKTITLERNSTIHTAVAVFVLLEALFLDISAVEWCIVLILIGLVLALELINSAIERLASKISPEQDTAIRTIKDTTAAGVLIASIAACIIGIHIFLSKIIIYFN